ncbi:RNA polymerase sigma factor [Pedobacter sp. SYP-B3415]|uniref:RNA polymerase sigma factor n=1 Tax=Pedobacter sp. SYP-B3415 TaxID=2496641 RepID=UPI00101DD31D|nr:sigma-70 family RNA polymerase sigma factor [Pedobacter sp. SYP-B3415]
MTQLLLHALKNDSRQAMKDIYTLHWEKVFDAAFFKTGDEAISQDITQEIFISLWEKRRDLRVDGSLDAYLYGAVKYRVINYFRSAALRESHQSAFALLTDECSALQADSRLRLNELNRELDAALALLPERMRLVMTMRKKEEKSISEIATELDVSVQTIKNQITASMKILRQNLSYLVFLTLFIR